MEDLATMINQVLSDPSAMEQIKTMASGLGLSGENSQQDSAPPQMDFSALFNNQTSDTPFDLSSIMMLQKAMSTFSQEDENTALLKALRPHFSQQRAKKVDDAIKLMQIIKLLPLVKEMGILGDLFGGSKNED